METAIGFKSSSWTRQQRTHIGASTTQQSSLPDFFQPFFGLPSTNLPCLSSADCLTTTPSPGSGASRYIDDASSNAPKYEFQFWPLTTSSSSAAPLPLLARTASNSSRRLAGGNPLLATTAARLSTLEARWFASTIASAASFSSFARNNNHTMPTTATPSVGMAGSSTNNRFSPPPGSLTAPSHEGVDDDLHKVLLEQNTIFIAVLVALYIVEFIIGILGNLAVILVIARQTNMHNVTNFFIANMALADILLAALSLPLTPHFTLTGEWKFGRILCHIMPFIQGAAFFACTLTLMNIAIDRWRNVCQPLTPRMSNSRCAMIIGLIWLFSALVCLPYGVLMKIDEESGHCAEDWPTTAETRIMFGTSVLILQYVVPLLVISICYILIWFRLKQRPRFSSASGERERRERERQNRLQTMLTLMVVFFAISWLPMNAMNLTFDFYQPSRLWHFANALFLASHAIAMSSICYNPILYAGLNETFRAGLRQLLGFAPTSPNTSTGGGDVPPPPNAGGGRQRHPSADQRSGVVNQQSYPLLTPRFGPGNTLSVDRPHFHPPQTKNGGLVKNADGSQNNASGLEGSSSGDSAVISTRHGKNNLETTQDQQNNITPLDQRQKQERGGGGGAKRTNQQVTKRMPLHQLPTHRELTATTTLGDSPVVVHQQKANHQHGFQQQRSDEPSDSEQIRLLPLNSGGNGSNANVSSVEAHFLPKKRTYSATDKNTDAGLSSTQGAAADGEGRSRPQVASAETLQHYDVLNGATDRHFQNVSGLTTSASHPTHLSSSPSPSTTSKSRRSEEKKSARPVVKQSP